MTDDLIGTQAPRTRITDPAEAVHRLEQAVPELTRHRRLEPAPINWSLMEEDLGTALPSDYKLLSELYPSFALSEGFIHVGLTKSGTERDNSGIFEGLQIVQDWWQADMSLGIPPHPAPGGLLPWTDTEGGDLFLWMTTGAPDDWPVTVATRGGEWWHYLGGAVQFLAELMDGTLEPWEMTDLTREVRVFDS
ncbi:SMI1/KNR4 family protein [Streptomyces sp. NPDC048566]|uniref:SMI1/KNR4 family protein n=1 Tax=Streptomyces sp. NPDC048566 TaxID=3365569 RepID=UPI003722F1BD